MSETMTTLNSAVLHPSVMGDEKLLEYVPGAVYVCDLDGVVVRYNKRAGELWGRYPVPGDPKELYCGSHKLYRANGDVMPHDETPMVDALRKGNSYRNLEVQVEQPSGKKIWILVNIDPLRSEAGDIVGVINCFQDITDRKLADQRQGILINELNHRVKNTLSTVQSIASQTFRDGVTADAPKRFESRLMVLSRAHDVLTRENWEGANLREIVGEVLAPLCGTSGDLAGTNDRFKASGPDIYLPSDLALSLAIVLHELCTNAAKYGALSNDNGQVSVEWALTNSDLARGFTLSWVERGGPDVALPTHKGFGLQVIERTLKRQHDASVSLSFPPSGVRCEIEAALA